MRTKKPLYISTMKQHEQIKLEGYTIYKGATVKNRDVKRAVYHKQRGASQKSKNIVRVRIKVEKADVINSINAKRYQDAQGREAKRISQRLERKRQRLAKRNK